MTKNRDISAEVLAQQAKTKRSDAVLRGTLYRRAAEMLRTGAKYADENESTWARVYAEAGLNLIRAAEAVS